MTISVLTRNQENTIINALGINDVSRFQFNENTLTVYFNDESNREYPLRDNDGEGNVDWGYVEIKIKRATLSLGMGGAL